MANTLTEQQLETLCDLDAAPPIALDQANVTQPFVYDRKHGLMYVPRGHHVIVMATLFAFDHGYDDYIDMTLATEHDVYELADQWLKDTLGSAFKSSLTGYAIQSGKSGNLNTAERVKFGDVRYMFHYDE